MHQSVDSENQAFEKYNAIEYEEFTTLLTNYRAAVEVAKKEIAEDQITTVVFLISDNF